MSSISIRRKCCQSMLHQVVVSRSARKRTLATTTVIDPILCSTTSTRSTCSSTLVLRRQYHQSHFQLQQHQQQQQQQQQPSYQSKRRPRTKPNTHVQQAQKLVKHSTSWTMAEWQEAGQTLHTLTWHTEVSSDTVHWAFRLLDRMAQESERQPQQFPLQLLHINAVLDRWRIGSRQRGVLHSKNFPTASRVWKTMENYAKRIPGLHLDAKSYSILMAVQIKQDPKNAPEVCSRIIQTMRSSSPPVSPNAVALTYLMDAHVQGNHPNAPLVTQSLFDFMVEQSAQDPLLEPSEKSLTRLLQAWVGLSQAAPQEVLPRMEHALDYLIAASENDPSALSNALFLDLVLEYTSHQDRLTPKTTLLADELVALVCRRAKEYPHLIPDPRTVCRLVNMWSKTDHRNAAPRAEYWLDEMCKYARQWNFFTPPRASVYATVLSTWEKSGLKEAPMHAESIWERLVDEAGITTGSYHVLLSTWAKSGLPDAPQRAHNVLRDMLEDSKRESGLFPSYQAFVQVLSAWSRQTLEDAAPQSQQVLDWLLEQHAEHPERYELDTRPFDMTLVAWSNSSSPHAGSAALAVVEGMVRLAGKQQPKLQLSNETICTALQCVDPSSPEAATQATELWNRVDKHSLVNEDGWLLDSMFERVLDCWSKSTKDVAPEQAEHLLDMYDDIIAQSDRQPTLHSLACIAHVVRAWNRVESEASVAMRQQWMDRMMAISETLENTDSQVVLAEAWAHSKLPEGLDHVQSILDQLLARWQKGEVVSPPDWANTLLYAFIDSGGLEFAEANLLKLEEAGLVRDLELQERMVRTLSQSLDKSQLQKATLMLEGMSTAFVENKGAYKTKPSAELFGSLMAALASVEAHGEVNRLWSLLQSLQRTFPDDPEFQSDTNVVLSLCKSDSGSGRKDSMLHNLLVTVRQGTGSVADVDTFHGVLDAISKSGDPSAGRRAEVILLKMQELFDEGRLSESPNFETFQRVINCWSKSTEEGAAQRADEILALAESLAAEGDLRLRPDPRGYLAVVQAWANSHSPDAPDKIQALFRKMKERFANGEKEFGLEASAYAGLITAYANSGHPDSSKLALAIFDAAPPALQTTELYNALIGAQGGDSTSAESILEGMHKAFLDGNKDVEPNTETFNMVLQAWSRSGSPMAAWRADGIFQRMTDLSASGQLAVQPNARTFDLVISTLANEFGADGALRVEHYLSLLKEYYESGEPDCAPSVNSYTEAIRAWGLNVDDPRAVLRAKALLDEMHELAKAGVSSVQPDLRTYGIYLKALSRSNADEKMQLARDVVSTMQSNGITPDGNLRSHIQRCSLPNHVVLSGWTVLLDERSCQDDEFPMLAISPDHYVGPSSSNSNNSSITL